MLEVKLDDKVILAIEQDCLEKLNKNIRRDEPSKTISSILDMSDEQLSSYNELLDYYLEREMRHEADKLQVVYDKAYKQTTRSFKDKRGFVPKGALEFDAEHHQMYDDIVRAETDKLSKI